ncbi:MAG: beta-ketoacyl-ACP synthase I, partial [Litorivicinaceae bacterium]
GADMVAPSGEGAIRCMQLATAGIEGPIDYINAHGTSTPAGDIVELNAIKTVFGMNAPVIGSTKSLSGHSLGAAGVQEAIYSILMMQSDFIAASANIETIDPEAEGMPIALHRIDKPINMILSNSFGFGGTNACMTFQKLNS